MPTTAPTATRRDAGGAVVGADVLSAQQRLVPTATR